MPRPKNRDKTRTKNFKPKTGKSYAERQQAYRLRLKSKKSAENLENGNHLKIDETPSAPKRPASPIPGSSGAPPKRLRSSV